MYRLKKAYLLIILALEASNRLQITFHIITNVQMAIFERFGPNFWANIHFNDGNGHFGGGGVSSGDRLDVMPIFCRVFKSPWL